MMFIKIIVKKRQAMNIKNHTLYNSYLIKVIEIIESRRLDPNKKEKNTKKDKTSFSLTRSIYIFHFSSSLLKH